MKIVCRVLEFLCLQYSHTLHVVLLSKKEKRDNIFLTIKFYLNVQYYWI